MEVEGDQDFVGYAEIWWSREMPVALEGVMYFRA